MEGWRGRNKPGCRGDTGFQPGHLKIMLDLFCYWDYVFMLYVGIGIETQQEWIQYTWNGIEINTFGNVVIGIDQYWIEYM